MPGRLVQAETTSTYSTSAAHCWGEAYVYDNQSTGSGEYGNLTNINPASTAYNGCTAENLSVASNASNQITSFSYDAVGNTLNDTHHTYGYTAESEIKSGGGVNYTYDGDGNRVEKSRGTLYWYGAGSTVLDESDTSGNMTDEYVFFGAKRLTHHVFSSNGYTYYAQDILGTNVVILSPTPGSPCYDADYYPFGGEREYVSTCAENYKFEGKKRDIETNNDDFGARYYSSSFGRWESPDWSSVPEPVPYANLTNPQTLNLYMMARDNPETFADLDGHYTVNGGDGTVGLHSQNGSFGWETGLSDLLPQNDNSGATQNQSQGAGQASGTVTFNFNGFTVTFSWTTFTEPQGSGVEIEATVNRCDSCMWAQTVSGSGIKGGTMADTQPGADPTKYPFTPATEHPAQLYDRPERSSPPAHLNFVSTTGVVGGKTFNVKASFTWGFNVNKTGDVKFGGVRLATPAEQKGSLAIWRRATGMDTIP